MKFSHGFQIVLLVILALTSLALSGIQLQIQHSAIAIASSNSSDLILPLNSTETSSGIKVSEMYSQLPLSFELNQGQTDPEVQYMARFSGYTLFLRDNELVLNLRRSAFMTGQDKDGEAAPETAMRMKLAGANPAPQAVGLDALPGVVNYFLGNDPSQWHTRIPTYAKVKYQDVYPGIDLVYYGKQGQLEYDFVVSPGTDPNVITLNYAGADKLEINGQGDLVLKMAENQINLLKPRVYQEEQGVYHEIPGGYVLKDENQVGFQVGTYDAAKALVIDPVLDYSTYLGGSRDDIGYGIAVDSEGNAYVTGYTGSSNFPTKKPRAVYGDGFDAFVSKLNATGSALIYSTYLGGNLEDRGKSLSVDAAGNAYVTGFTQSSNFPTKNPLQAKFGGVADAFIAKVNATGSALLYSTYIGGSTQQDIGQSIAVDAAGNAYVTGFTQSSNFPTKNPLQAKFGGVADAFIAKVNAAGSALIYSTYLGGSNGDGGQSIAVDTAGNAYVTGSTYSSNFPTKNPLQTTYGGASDAFIAKVNATGSALLYSTYLGGSNGDGGQSIAVDTAGNAYVTGFTQSSNFPTKNPLQTTFGRNSAAFLTKLNTDGSEMVYSTYLGVSSEFDWGNGIALDTTSNAYVAGFTQTRNGSSDGFVVKVNAAGSMLLYNTLFGGSNEEEGLGIAVDTAGNAYVTGQTDSSDFPLQGAFQNTYGVGTCGIAPNTFSCNDAFIVKITDTPRASADLALTKTDSPDPVSIGKNLTYTVTVSNNGPDAATKVSVTDKLPSGATFVSVTPNQGACNGTNSVTCDLGTINKGASATVTLVVTPTSAGTLTNTASVTASESDPNPVNNTATQETQVTKGSADLFLTKTDSQDPLIVGNTLTYTLTVVNNGPDQATGVILTDPLPEGITFVSAGFSQGGCTKESNTLTCNLGTLANAASAVVTIVVTPTKPGVITNTAHVELNETDSNPENNTASQSTTIQAVADLAVSQSDSPDPVNVGENLTYAITINNNGPSAATAIIVSDALPSGVTRISAVPTQGSCSGNAIIVCTLGDLASGGSAKVTIVVKAPTTAGTLTNRVEVGSNETDPTPSNNTSTENTTVK
jgi:uncharacterized repeat protein (TIGR01451 family)